MGSLFYYPLILSFHCFCIFVESLCCELDSCFCFHCHYFGFNTCTAKRSELASNLLHGGFLPRLLLTCLSQPEVANVWVERIRENPSVYDCVCFIMSSSTNGKLPKQPEILVGVCRRKITTEVCNFKDKYFQLG